MEIEDATDNEEGDAVEAESEENILVEAAAIRSTGCWTNSQKATEADVKWAATQWPFPWAQKPSLQDDPEFEEAMSDLEGSDVSEVEPLWMVNSK